MEGIQETVRDILSDFTGIDRAKELFSLLNYENARGRLSCQNWSETAKKSVAGDPQVIATHGPFQIIYSRLASGKLRITYERSVINSLLHEHPYSLFLFSTEDQKLWHFVNVRLYGNGDKKQHKNLRKRRLFRRITIGEKETRLRTATDRISMLDLSELGGDIPPFEVQSKHDEAFNVEAVTDEFYGKYEGLFRMLMGDLEKQTKERQWAHNYALQLLNRTMFLYFVQRKGWLGNNGEFLEEYWTSYHKTNQRKNRFFDDWLTILFFEVFNTPAGERIVKQKKYISEEIRSALSEAPYLNGGLFDKNELDGIGFTVVDNQFNKIFNLFQSYNFTITEDSPLDQEVAVDPEMIGRVYESLVRRTEEDIKPSEAGVVYTPRTEIDLMCRLSLVDNLANHLGEIHKNLFYELVFSFEEEEKEQADKALTEAGLWPDVERRLNEVTALDPACGSGSFLVGMLHILDDLLERAEKQRGDKGNKFERKKRIIGKSLYGVEVMDWACHVAELRLWLSLIVDAEFTKNELKCYKQPLLPNFNFNIRCGDSLVQQVGDVDISHRRDPLDISNNIKYKLENLKTERYKFYFNEKRRKFKSDEELKSCEVNIFKELLKEQLVRLNTQVQKLTRQKAELKVHRQMMLTGELEGSPEQLTLKHETLQQQITNITEEKHKIESVFRGIRGRKTTPFAWDIAFAEIFLGDNRGFDIVVGNPPYIRQEKIADPKLSKDEITTENKKAYKAKLARLIYKTYPFFRYSASSDKAVHKIDAKSDLYIYFYFLALSLLNDKGTFCFITSNSWLDVGYGKDLQEFLLKRSHVKLVLDNKAKRSFKESDVNTVIVLFGPPANPKISDDVSLEKTARFVMLNVPFAEVLHPVFFEEIEEANKKTTREEYRVFPVKQAELFAGGCEIPKEEKKKSTGPLIKVAKYIGNKWGGKYLRAPDIYWTILKKGKGKLVRLGDIAEVRRGFTTGANEFFYLNNEKIKEWGIEKRFLKPVITSPRECVSVIIKQADLKFRAFTCHKDKSELRGTTALEYIKWGEKSRKDNNGKEIGQFHKRPTCKGRKRWYDLVEREWAYVLWPMIHNDRQNVFWNSESFIVDHNLFEILGLDNDILWGSLAWTAQLLFRELHGRANLGQGALKTEGIDIRTFYCFSEAAPNIVRAIRSARNTLSRRPIKMVAEESKMDDRKSVDDIFFEMLKLTQSEREAVYEAVIDLVESRLKKAESLKE